MPVGPSEIDTNMQQRIDPSTIERSVCYIDQKLHDAEFIKDWRYGPPGSYWWNILLHNELTEAEKKMIVMLYINAGWKGVVCKNSSENDERPGLCSVRFYSW
jgi:hypothetical protein